MEKNYKYQYAIRGNALFIFRAESIFNCKNVEVLKQSEMKWRELTWDEINYLEIVPFVTDMVTEEQACEYAEKLGIPSAVFYS